MVFKFSITQKLSLFFFLFFIIFSATVSLLLFNVQSMVKTTEDIVEINYQIEALSKIMLASLLDMESNSKKINLLKKRRYSELFIDAKNRFEDALTSALTLGDGNEPISRHWHELQHSYDRHTSGLLDSASDSPLIGSLWVSEQVVTQWIDSISRIKRENQQAIDLGLLKLNQRSKNSVSNGIYGFVISIIIGIIGLGFFSRSILSPLRALTEELKRLSSDKLYQPISLKGGDEFSKLAIAYNDMSRQLYEEESIRNEFIATLSHEIRTPLSSIHESVNMTIEEVFGPMNAKQQKFLRIASVEIHRIKKLLNHLLDVSILESDSRKQKSIQLDTRKLIFNAFHSFASIAEKKNISIVVNGSKNPSPLFGVKEEIEQVFVNIIGNAIKFSPNESTVTIYFSQEKEKDFLLFNISDYGPGIPEDELSLVFAKYYRTKDSREHLDGVGLGLSISRKIVSSYGGSIFVTNNPNQGCTFTFTLPTLEL